MKEFNIVIIGAGASGLMAAIRASKFTPLGKSVPAKEQSSLTGFTNKILLLEKSNSLGRKLLLSGKGRCNLTNTAELEDFLTHFGKQGNFLRNAFSCFFNTELIEFFENRGLKLKAERGGRIFPESDLSKSVLDILRYDIIKQGVEVYYKAKVVEVKLNANKEIILSNGNKIIAKRIILATGGVSYPLTGSTGDGYSIAESLGHKIIPLRAGLIPLEVKEKWIRDLTGLSLRNVKVKLLSKKKTISSDIGEMIFTHFGISGPLILSLSAKVVDLLQTHKAVTVSIDLKPALTDNQLDDRVLREIKNHGSVFYKNLLKGLLPRKLIEVFVGLSGINPQKAINQITQKERLRITSLLKDFRLTIIKARPIKEAVVTRGGVSTREINPKTMESTLVKGLYFCGEVIDVDADTGGYNLQAAFSTGYLAAESAAKSLEQ
ncbi:MAG: NAD(P)/FAD-dependent oxidoreductase [Candidatus Omnitrophica bacterium]|nr:NAD(P)/FAD-dependent oxidoreductase [Candidatus Omnitrophota bacterium]